MSERFMPEDYAGRIIHLLREGITYCGIPWATHAPKDHLWMAEGDTLWSSTVNCPACKDARWPMDAMARKDRSPAWADHPKVMLRQEAMVRAIPRTLGLIVEERNPTATELLEGFDRLAAKGLEPEVPSDRPDYVRCIREAPADQPGNKTPLCDRMAFAFFTDPEHAQLNGEKNGRLLCCPECAKIAGVTAGVWSPGRIPSFPSTLHIRWSFGTACNPGDVPAGAYLAEGDEEANCPACIEARARLIEHARSRPGVRFTPIRHEPLPLWEVVLHTDAPEPFWCIHVDGKPLAWEKDELELIVRAVNALRSRGE